MIGDYDKKLLPGLVLERVGGAIPLPASWRASGAPY
jgi:hypothetical protein